MTYLPVWLIIIEFIGLSALEDGKEASNQTTQKTSNDGNDKSWYQGGQLVASLLSRGPAFNDNATQAVCVRVCMCHMCKYWAWVSLQLSAHVHTKWFLHANKVIMSLHLLG